MSTGGLGCLQARALLSSLREGMSYHEQLDRRHPLGIYNVSINRVCSNLQKCCQKAEAYWRAGTTIAALQGHAALRDELVDYFELCIYAAAEHVDDVEAIASCFFSTSSAFSASHEVKHLKKSLKTARNQICTVANAIKHNQSRLRIFSLEFVHDHTPTCLHGFFVEGFSKGTIGPSPIVHRENARVISVTSFLWGIVLFLTSASNMLAAFLRSISAASDDTPVSSGELGDAVMKLARLPLYSFDETHPFEATRVIIDADEAARERLKSGLHGSIVDRWSKSDVGEFRRYTLGYEGDGATRSFQMTIPTVLRIQHWD